MITIITAQEEMPQTSTERIHAVYDKDGEPADLRLLIAHNPKIRNERNKTIYILIQSNFIIYDA